MNDREFLDEIYQLWSKTSGAEDSYYVVEEDTDYYIDGPGTYVVWSTDEQGRKLFVASFDTETDADWFASIHGCFADLVRRLQDALDEADRLDERADNAIAQVADLELLLSQESEDNRLFKQELANYEDLYLELSRENRLLLAEVGSLEDELSSIYREPCEDR